MALVNVSELSGAALDYVVALCEGVPDSEYVRTHLDAWLYSSDWSQGGPIIDREGIAIRRHSSGTWYAMLSSDLGDDGHASWGEVTFKGDTLRYGKFSYEVAGRVVRWAGESALIAAMRCYVASRLKPAEHDNERLIYRIEILDELLQVKA